MEIIKRNPKELIQADYNPRKISDKDFKQLKKSLETFQCVEPIVVNQFEGREDVIVGGHQRLKAMESLGWSEVPTVEVYLDLDEEKELNVRLNKNTGEFDFELLTDLFDTDKLEEIGFELDELPEITEDLTEPLTDPDEAPEPPKEPKTKLGDIYELGNHRLMCGDSTSIDAVEKLIDGNKIDFVHTDPPYGINEKGDRSNRGGARKRNKLEDFVDDSIQYAIDSYNICESMNIKTMVFWGANYYCHSLPQTNNWLIWDKRVEENQTDTNSDCELAFVKSNTNSCRIFRHLWKGMIKESERGEKRVHPTQKPVELVKHCFNRYDHNSKNVLDLFGGSGSTLIACEETNKSAYLMELSEHYCDVIVERWENFTGKKAKLITKGGE